MRTIIVTVSNGFSNATKEVSFEMEDDATDEEINKIAFELMLEIIDYGWYEKDNK